MKNYSWLLLAGLAMSLLSCSTSGSKNSEAGEWQTVESEGFSISLPSHLKPTENLNEDAIVEYQDLSKEYYVIVISESIEEFHQAIADAELEEDYPTTGIETYSQFIKDRFESNVDDMRNITEMKKLKVHGNEARYFESNATVSGIDIFYHYGFIEGDSTYYQVMSWTLSKKEPDFKEAMLESLKSLKEVTVK
jgi:hypothetical protein